MDNPIVIAKNTIDGENVQTVNARDLHAFLQSKQDFSTWIKKRIMTYAFLDGKDFVRFHKKMEANNAIAVEYYLTLDMAKELAMVERNKKGKQAREYFIECERRAKQAATSQLNLASALENSLTVKKLLLESINQLETLKSEVNTLKPKAMAFESLLRSDGLFGLMTAAKILQMKPKQFILFLQKKRWIYRLTSGAPLLPYQDKIKKGLMDCPTHIIQTREGTERIVPTAKITTKGMGVLSQELTTQSVH